MKYFFISDVHGEYDKLIKSLMTKNFNPQTDTLVSLGDLFDRGLKNKEVLEFVMGCPHRILICGNHEAAFKHCLLEGIITKTNIHNGLSQTLYNFCDNTEHNPYLALQIFKTDARYQNTRNLLWQYFDECVWGIEFSNLIATHAWIPTTLNWRRASKDDWEYASWSNPEERMNYRVLPDKDMIVGHWWSFLISKLFNEKHFKEYLQDKRDAFECCCDIVKCKKGKVNITFIDGAANMKNGQVNVYVVETDETPIYYKGERNDTI